MVTMVIEFKDNERCGFLVRFINLDSDGHGWIYIHCKSGVLKYFQCCHEKPKRRQRHEMSSDQIGRPKHSYTNSTI